MPFLGRCTITMPLLTELFQSLIPPKTANRPKRAYKARNRAPIEHQSRNNRAPIKEQSRDAGGHPQGNWLAHSLHRAWHRRAPDSPLRPVPFQSPLTRDKASKSAAEMGGICRVLLRPQPPQGSGRSTHSQIGCDPPHPGRTGAPFPVDPLSLSGVHFLPIQKITRN